MIQCPSKNEVDKIIALDRWIFQGFRVFADRWIENAGRSRVQTSSGDLWIHFYGIPLHLRSRDLFHQLGMYCGEVLEVQEEGLSLNEVRVRVRPNDMIPDE
ncbi:unnamed protein product [Linum tenue]|uniref:DUF4283 domain-containing protein n=1 Tax=Linum tenue TaxID=586396 RepID=A0AAV0NID0_9ROSI|nr:unnamed protein product [Linum tenue]